MPGWRSGSRKRDARLHLGPREVGQAVPDGLERLAGPILGASGRRPARVGPRSHSATVVNPARIAVMPNAMCAVCGKGVLPAPLGGSDVREGERRFHSGCYFLFKRQPPPFLRPEPPPPASSPA